VDGAGAVGLMQAAERFQPGRGLAFSTYAAFRIRGAISDEWRRLYRWRQEERGAPWDQPTVVELDVDHVHARADMQRALGGLSEPDRRLLIRLFYEDVPAVMIAEQEGVTEGAISLRRKKALARLRTLLTTNQQEHHGDQAAADQGQAG